MSSTLGRPAAVVPAQLSFLAIYNPSLGNTDETFRDQVVFYSSKANRARRKRTSSDSRSKEKEHEEENEKLRQIGLAQGMVESFSDGEAVDSVETEKSRIILHELEPGWWILASVDLTRLPSSSTPQSSEGTPTGSNIEYSAREVSPPALLLQHLLRAHSIFLLHHAPSLGELFSRLDRAKFTTILDKFWTRFILSWDVMLHGNPAVDIFGGLKLAAGGELGIGVGEEEWGSGEREVLEDFARRTEGLVDLVVSRFGEAPATDKVESKLRKSDKSNSSEGEELPLWEGSGSLPGSADGVAFSGVGAISRTSLRDISSWVEWLYTYGEDAYGVSDNPHTTHRRKRRRGRSALADGKVHLSNSENRNAKPALKARNPSFSPNRIPPSIMSKANKSLDPATKSVATSKQGTNATRSQNDTPKDNETSAYGTETLVKYLTLGYGSVWGPSSRSSSQNPTTTERVTESRQGDNINHSNGIGVEQPDDSRPDLERVGPDPEQSPVEEPKFAQARGKTIGHFLIGLKGDLENEKDSDDEGEGPGTRTLLRTLNVELPEPKESTNDGTGRSQGHHSTRPSLFKFDSTDSINRSVIRSEGSTSPKRYRKLRVIVYMHQPFIFTFLFELQTPSLALSSFYRSLHHQLGPLQRPLLSSTSPTKVSERLVAASAPRITSTTTSSQPIYDLVYDPSNLTIHTSLPNIPEPSIGNFEPSNTSHQAWTRIEALNVHTQILNTHNSTRGYPSELERTCKTSRGWWVVWMRLPCPSAKSNNSENEELDDNLIYREAFLVRKASDYILPASQRKTGGKYARDTSGVSGTGGGWVPGKLAEGIGVDTRKYIEGLLSLNR
ncbi:MAG: hypothetical protein M1812_007289 [Candelaria pacifica]|nr:MAG: hypothetical protein M1812_007289 [Candelaria pacifica]